jgi:hypothetical protein
MTTLTPDPGTWGTEQQLFNTATGVISSYAPLDCCGARTWFRLAKPQVPEPKPEAPKPEMKELSPRAKRGRVKAEQMLAHSASF